MPSALGSVGEDELGGADGADTALLEQVGHELADEGFELAVELGELLLEELRAAGEPAQHPTGGRA